MNYQKKHILAIVVAFIIVFISLILAWVYRPYIYTHHIYDFHFADTFSNLAAVPASSLFYWGLKKGK